MARVMVPKHRPTWTKFDMHTICITRIHVSCPIHMIQSNIIVNVNYIIIILINSVRKLNDLSDN